MLFSKPGLKLVNRWLIVTPLFFQRKTATGLQEGASGLQQMSWATSYKLEKESNPLRLIMGRGHTRSCVTSLWDREKATASYWISRDRAWNLSCWLQAFMLQEQCLLLWGGYRPYRGAGRRTRKAMTTLWGWLWAQTSPQRMATAALHLPHYLHRCKVVRKPRPED